MKPSVQPGQTLDSGLFGLFVFFLKASAVSEVLGSINRRFLH